MFHVKHYKGVHIERSFIMDKCISNYFKCDTKRMRTVAHGI